VRGEQQLLPNAPHALLLNAESVVLESRPLSKEIDSRVKSSVADFCGKDSYEPGDLTKEVTNRMKSRVEEFTGKPYQFGDISREIEQQRVEWVTDYLGKENCAHE
jgi:hypothetical protein